MIPLASYIIFGGWHFDKSIPGAYTAFGNLEWHDTHFAGEFFISVRTKKEEFLTRLSTAAMDASMWDLIAAGSMCDVSSCKSFHCFVVILLWLPTNFWSSCKGGMLNHNFWETSENHLVNSNLNELPCNLSLSSGGRTWTFQLKRLWKPQGCLRL